MDADTVLMSQKVPKEEWFYQRKYLNLQIMNLEQLVEETNNLQQLNIASLTPEQLEQLLTKISSIIETGEKQLSEIKIETNE